MHETAARSGATKVLESAHRLLPRHTRSASVPNLALPHEVAPAPRACLAFLRTLALVGCVGALGCTGDLDWGPAGPDGFHRRDPDAPDGGGTVTMPTGMCEVPAFACTPTQTLPESDLPRLTRTQYTNSLRDLLHTVAPGGDFDAVWTAAQPALGMVPTDEVGRHSRFTSMDQVVSDVHVSSYLAVGIAVGSALTADDGRTRRVLACAPGASDDECVDAFIRRIARLAYHRPASDAEIAYLHEVYASTGIDGAGVSDVVAVVLNTPEFLYQLQFGADPVPGAANTYALTPFEVANKLAYQLWRTEPDDDLLMAVESGELDTDAGYAAFVDTMLEDPRSEAGLRAFATEWLNPTWVAELDIHVGTPAFDAFAGTNVPSANLRTDMVTEVADSLVYHTMRGDSLSDWFASPYSFARTAELGAIYGVPAWNGSAEPPMFPAGERAGLLTRAAFLANASGNTRPIQKGVFIREQILCDTIGMPPMISSADQAAVATATTTRTTRQSVEQVTSRTGCVECHGETINPLGFATENFDALGRLRHEQVIYGDDGGELAHLPVDTSGVRHLCAADRAPSTGASDLTQGIIASGKLEACVARQYVRFLTGRPETAATDGCALAEIQTALLAGGDIRSAIRAAALRPEYRQRYVGDAP